MSWGIESYDLVFLTKGCEKRCEKAVRRLLKAAKNGEAILYLDYL